MERYRKVIMTARLIYIRGRIQRHEDIIHVVSGRLEDRSHWLAELSEWAHDDKRNAGSRLPMPTRCAGPIPVRPVTSISRAFHPRWAGHPRNERIIPKSRDFH